MTVDGYSGGSVGSPCSNIWPHIHRQMDNPNGPQGAKKWNRYEVGRRAIPEKIQGSKLYYRVLWNSQKLFKIIQEWKGNEVASVGAWSWQLKTYDTLLMLSHYVLVCIIVHFIISERQGKLLLLMYKQGKLCIEKLRIHSGIIYNLAHWHKCSHDKQE